MTISIQQFKQQRDRILALAGRFHAENVRVFGSVVRNEANDDSDVDFLLSGELRIPDAEKLLEEALA